MDKITGYPNLSALFGNGDFFEVSKNKPQTSGVLVVGEIYTIDTFVAGDNFTNVASVISGTINTTGCVFEAIGTTPTTYSNGSTLSYFESQRYTFEDLFTSLDQSTATGRKVYEFVFDQSAMDAPTVVVKKSTLSGTPTWTRVANGTYRGTLTGAFPAGKTYSLGAIVNSQFDSSRIVLSLARETDNSVLLTGYDVSNLSTNLDSLITDAFLVLYVFN